MTQTNEELLEELENTDLASDSDLLAISKLMDLQIERMGRVDKLKVELDTANTELLDVSDRLLVDALKNARTKLHVNDNGAKVELTEKMTLSLPKKRLDEIIEKLRSWGYKDLVSNTLICTVEKGQDNLAGELMAQAEKLGLEMVRSEAVNTGSVKKILKDRMSDHANGKKDKQGKDIEAIDLTFWGAFEVRRAKITQ